MGDGLSGGIRPSLARPRGSEGGYEHLLGVEEETMDSQDERVMSELSSGASAVISAPSAADFGTEQALSPALPCRILSVPPPPILQNLTLLHRLYHCTRSPPTILNVRNCHPRRARPPQTLKNSRIPIITPPLSRLCRRPPQGPSQGPAEEGTAPQIPSRRSEQACSRPFCFQDSQETETTLLSPLQNTSQSTTRMIPPPLHAPSLRRIPSRSRFPRLVYPPTRPQGRL